MNDPEPPVEVAAKTARLVDTGLIEAVRSTVAYTDVFDMPVEMHDLHTTLIGVLATSDDVERAVEVAVDSGAIERHGGRLCLPGRAIVVSIADDRQARARALWPSARRWSKALAALPYVRMVAITGGLACDSVEPYDDIDLFLVVAPGRLWLTRLAVVTVAKLVDLRGPELCPNYIVTTGALEFDVRTTYVAREIAQMVPVHGSVAYDRLIEVNDWYREHVPNHRPAQFDDTLHRPGPVKRFVEAVGSMKLFDRLERWEMDRKVAKLTATGSRRAEVGRPDESAFSPDVCKGHVVGNARGIDDAWRDRLARR